MPESREEHEPGDVDERRPLETISLGEAVGGPLGVAEATLPFIAFTIAWTASDQNVGFGAIVAVSIAALLTAARLARGQSIQYAVSGLFGVALGAFVAARTGEASAFFLPGILINSAWIVAYLVSIAVRRPLLGLFLSQLTGEGRAWYQDPARRRAYTLASWIWVGLFGIRLAIQLPLYISDSVALLAVARVVTGAPLFALALWLSYLVLKPIIDASGGLRVPKPGGR